VTATLTAEGVDLVGRWWNRGWGRLARREVWLLREMRWMVVARQGDSETGKMIDWEFDDEDQARIMVERLLDVDGPGRWREMDHRKMSPPLGYGTRSKRPE
jgi:hypothetical protein